MYKDLLPIGSVVLLKGGQRKLMVVGRVVCKEDDNKIYDYIGCLYPQGILTTSELYFFNTESIENVFFIGFQDTEEMSFKGFLENLGELEVVNGQIVPKER